MGIPVLAGDSVVLQSPDDPYPTVTVVFAPPDTAQTVAGRALVLAGADAGDGNVFEADSQTAIASFKGLPVILADAVLTPIAGPYVGWTQVDSIIHVPTGITVDLE
jgi:hypothetical protein